MVPIQIRQLNGRFSFQNCFLALSKLSEVEGSPGIQFDPLPFRFRSKGSLKILVMIPKGATKKK
jgi:hypothetical protein